MRLLMFYTHEWWYKTAAKSLADAPDAGREEATSGGAVVIFFHAEAGDEAKGAGVVEKFTKNVKWLAGKFETKQIVLHSFNHLSSSKAEPEFALAVADEVEARLVRTGYSVMRTPFGYFNEFRMHVAGDSLAKVFKEF